MINPKVNIKDIKQIQNFLNTWWFRDAVSNNTSYMIATLFGYTDRYESLISVNFQVIMSEVMVLINKIHLCYKKKIDSRLSNQIIHVELQVICNKSSPLMRI